MNKDNLKPIPEIGKYYHFWDDGKCSPGRHYICRVEKLISVKESKGILVSVPEWDDETEQNWFNRVTLYERWKEQVENHDWIYDEDTDYIVEISCPEYDENNLYAVRTKNGGWFTIDVQNFWQGGRLDVTGEIYESILNDWELNEGYIPYEEYPEADEKHYNNRFDK